MSIDRLDLKIIRSLNKNARKPYKDIAKELDVSDTTVKLQDVVKTLEDNPDVQVLYRTTGQVDLFVEVIFRDMEELNSFLESELNIEGVTGTDVTLVIGPYKRCPCTGL